MKLSSPEQKNSRLTSILFVILLTGASIMLGRYLKNTESSKMDRTKNPQIHPQTTTGDILKRTTELLTPSLSHKTAVEFLGEKKHACGGRRRSCRRKHGSFGKRKARCGGGAQGWGQLRLKKGRWNAKPKTDFGNFLFGGKTYYYKTAEKKECYYFDPSGREHFSKVEEVQLFTEKVTIGGVEYTCKKAETDGKQRCYTENPDMRKRYVWKADVKEPEKKEITLKDQKFEIFVVNKQENVIYIIENGQKIFLPRAQAEFLLSADTEKSFEANGLTYYYVDVRKDRCWTVINGQREEYFVSTVKDYGTFIGMDGVKYYFADKEKKKAFFLNEKGERIFVIPTKVAYFGSFVSQGTRFYFSDATQTQCFKILGDKRITFKVNEIKDFGEFTGNDGKIYFFSDNKHERAYSKDATTGAVAFVNAADVGIKTIKKEQTMFYFFVKEDMYYYVEPERKKCFKFGEASKLVDVVTVFKVEDKAFTPLEFTLVKEDKTEVKYRFEDLSRERCFIFKQGEMVEKIEKFDEVKGEKYFVWGDKKWYFADKTKVKGWLALTETDITKLNAQEITLATIGFVKPEIEAKGEEMELKRLANDEKEKKQFEDDQKSPIPE